MYYINTQALIAWKRQLELNAPNTQHNQQNLHNELVLLTIQKISTKISSILSSVLNIMTKSHWGKEK